MYHQEATKGNLSRRAALTYGMNHTSSEYALMAYSERVCQLKKESKSLKDVIHYHMEVIMGRSEHTPRYESVDSSGQQCIKTHENLFGDVARVKDMVISIQGMPCHSSVISRYSSLMSGGLITWGHFCHPRSMSISWWQWIMSPNGLKPCHARMLTVCIQRRLLKKTYFLDLEF